MSLIYILKRLGLTILTVICATFLCFMMVRLSPGDPADLILQKVFVGMEDYSGDMESRKAIVERFDLDRPLFMQYGSWLVGAVTGDLGHSFRTGQPVSREMGLRLGPTFTLSLGAMVISLLMTMVFVGGMQGRGFLFSRVPWMGKVLDMLIVASIAVPNFYLALLLILLFSVKLNLLPVSGYGGGAHFVLPVFTLAMTLFGYTTTILNDAVSNVRQQGFILTARGKGLTPAKIFRSHLLRNAMVPVIPYIALQMGYVLGGVVVVESVFAWPGLGSYLVSSIQTRDIPAIQACIAFMALAFSLSNLAADFCIWLLDPRVRL
ncbi:MAG: ABC transporter permease [Desulfamplus sp.]|nr:ABC transporter permease [Desulfamplus sp.]